MRRSMRRSQRIRSSSRGLGRWSGDAAAPISAHHARLAVFDFTEEDDDTLQNRFTGAPGEKKVKKHIKALFGSKKRCSSGRKRRSVASLTAHTCTKIERDLKSQPVYHHDGQLSSDSGHFQISASGSSGIQDGCQETLKNQSFLNNSEGFTVGSNKSNMVDLTEDAELGVIKRDSAHFSACLDHQATDVQDFTGGMKKVVIIAQHLLLCQSLYFPLAVVTFTAEGIQLKIVGDSELGLMNVDTIQWSFAQITSLTPCTNLDVGCVLIKVGVSDDGIKAFASIIKDTDGTRALKSILGRAPLCNECGHSMFFYVDSNTWLEQQQQVAGLCDNYRLLLFHKDENLLKRMGDGGSEDVTNKQSSEMLTSGMYGISAWREIVYPKEDPDAVTITETDFCLLNPSNFLSDTIIDFYIKYLQTSLLEEHQQRFYFYNSFFFRKLTELEYRSSCGIERRKAAFDGVKRWTSKTNIFEKDYLFVPVMQSSHWSLVVICYANQLLADGHNGSARECCILHLDSLQGCHTGLEEPIKDYLVEAWIQKFGLQSENLDYAFKRLSEIKFIHAKVPQQANHFDCGLFLLHYVELFIEQAQDVPDCLKEDWFDPAEASAKRATIRELMIKLLTNDTSLILESSSPEQTMDGNMSRSKMDGNMSRSNSDLAHDGQGCSLRIFNNYFPNEHTCGTWCLPCNQTTNKEIHFVTDDAPVANNKFLEHDTRTWKGVIHGMHAPAAFLVTQVLPGCTARCMECSVKQAFLCEQSDLVRNSGCGKCDNVISCCKIAVSRGLCLENTIDHDLDTAYSRKGFLESPAILQSGKHFGPFVRLLESMDALQFTNFRNYTSSLMDYDKCVYPVMCTRQWETETCTSVPSKIPECIHFCETNVTKLHAQDQLEISVEKNTHVQESITGNTLNAATDSVMDCKKVEDIVMLSMQHIAGTSIPDMPDPVTTEEHPSDDLGRIDAKQNYECSISPDRDEREELKLDTITHSKFIPVKQSCMGYEGVKDIMKREAQAVELSLDELDDAAYVNNSSDAEGVEYIRNTIDIKELHMVSNDRRNCRGSFTEKLATGSPLTRSMKKRQEKLGMISALSDYIKKRRQIST